MEKSIHTHLFAAAVSAKELRLVFMAGTPEQQKFDDAAAAIETAIEDPTKLTSELILKIAELKVSAIEDKVNSKRAEKLNDIVNKKIDLQREITDAEKKTADSNPDWKKVTEDIKSTDVAKKAVAIEDAQKLIVESRDKINDLSGSILSLDDLEPKLLAKITVKTIAAYNKNIENVQALDKDNVIPFVPVADAIGGDTAKDALKALVDRGNEFISTTLKTAIKAVEDTKGRPGESKVAREKLDTVVKERREEIYQQINDASNGAPKAFVNAEKQVAALLGQLKEMNDEVAAVLGTKEASAEAKAASPEAAKSLVEKGVDAAKNAVLAVPAIAKDIIDKGADALSSLQEKLTDKEKADLKDKLNEELKKQGSDKHVEQDPKTGKLEVKKGTPTEAEKAATPSAKEKSQLEQFLAFFKELIDFLRGEKMTNGDLEVMKKEIITIDEQITKIKKDSPDFNTKPDIMKKITDLEIKKNELQATINRGKKIGTQLVSDANRFINGSPTPLSVRVAQDKNGNTYLGTTRSTPEACGQLDYMTGRLSALHPELGFNQRAGVGQRVYLHVHGDININSKNNNSRTINNTNNVSGRNNTASASADGSQNGNNAASGTLDSAPKGTARNRAAERPQTTPNPMPPPRRARILNVPTPPAGNLS